MSRAGAATSQSSLFGPSGVARVTSPQPNASQEGQLCVPLPICASRCVCCRHFQLRWQLANPIKSGLLTSKSAVYPEAWPITTGWRPAQNATPEARRLVEEPLQAA